VKSTIILLALMGALAACEDFAAQDQMMTESDSAATSADDDTAVSGTHEQDRDRDQTGTHSGG
jgi:hypothetical protein